MEKNGTTKMEINVHIVPDYNKIGLVYGEGGRIPPDIKGPLETTGICSEPLPLD
jgi:hypothetical protein